VLNSGKLRFNHSCGASGWVSAPLDRLAGNPFVAPAGREDESAACAATAKESHVANARRIALDNPPGTHALKGAAQVSKAVG